MASVTILWPLPPHPLLSFFLSLQLSITQLSAWKVGEPGRLTEHPSAAADLLFQGVSRRPHKSPSSVINQESFTFLNGWVSNLCTRANISMRCPGSEDGLLGESCSAAWKNKFTKHSKFLCTSPFDPSQPSPACHVRKTKKPWCF